MLFALRAPHDMPPVSKSICEVAAPSIVSFFVAIPNVVSDETPAPKTSGTAFASTAGVNTAVVVKAPVNVVALIVSLKITPVQFVPPIVRVPAVVVSIEFAVRAPHFIPPVSTSILEVADPSIVTFFVAIPIFVSEVRFIPILRGTPFASNASARSVLPRIPPDDVICPQSTVPVEMLIVLAALPAIFTVFSALPIAIVPDEPAKFPFPILTL
jgi:hypothetical protein